VLLRLKKDRGALVEQTMTAVASKEKGREGKENPRSRGGTIGRGLESERGLDDARKHEAKKIGFAKTPKVRQRNKGEEGKREGEWNQYRGTLVKFEQREKNLSYLWSRERKRTQTLFGGHFNHLASNSKQRMAQQTSKTVKMAKQVDLGTHLNAQACGVTVNGRNSTLEALWQKTSHR